HYLTVAGHMYLREESEKSRAKDASIQASPDPSLLRFNNASMSDANEQNEQAKPVLKVSVHDVRHFASLLRGVNFANRATFTVTEKGLVIIVEEARTLL
ncbi:hypothetical protein MPER_14653, partial [Moniliophthora perniciosa FA553]